MSRGRGRRVDCSNQRRHGTGKKWPLAHALRNRCAVIAARTIKVNTEPSNPYAPPVIQSGPVTVPCNRPLASWPDTAIEKIEPSV